MRTSPSLFSRVRQPAGLACALLVSALGGSLAAQTTSTAAAPGFPAGWPLPIVLSGNIPVDLVPAGKSPTLTPLTARPFFDLFSWQSFIALNWPAKAGSPGVPNQPTTPSVFTSAKNGSPVVWMSYKTSDDLFGTGTQRPAPWGTVSDHSAVPGWTPGMAVFHNLSKSSAPDALNDTTQAFSFPLIDQNSHYVRYEVRYNQPFYTFVRGSDTNQSSWLYLLKNSPKITQPVSMPSSASPSTVGSLMVKASWREMTPADITGQRYYIIQALVFDPTTQSYLPKSMGLVGLHIAQKVQGLPEWIWSTFEQVDNVQRGVGSKSTTPISFNNGTASPASPNGWANRPLPPQPAPNPSPVQVTRYNPIPTTPAGSSTVNINAAFQKALAGTVWQYYELAITQWPSDPTAFQTPDSGGSYATGGGGAFPANGCVNTTMETYLQAASDATGRGGNSCMQCHYNASLTDYSWGLKLRAH